MTATTLVVLAIVVDEDCYLVVEERDGSFYLPAGRVESGENLVAAVIRETAEEAGIPIGLKGILGIDHDWTPGSPPRAKMRFAFVGYAAHHQGVRVTPKSRADNHSRGARWATKEQIAKLPLRHAEVMTWIERYERATTLLPCEAYEWFGPECGASWAAPIG